MASLFASTFYVIPAKSQGRHDYAPGELVLKLKSGVQIDIKKRITGSTAVNALMDDLNVVEMKPLLNLPENESPTISGLDRYIMLTFNGNPDMLALAARFMQSPDVEFAVPNYLMSATVDPPNDDKYGNQWALNDTAKAKLNVPSAWNITTGNRIVVAVIDSGLDINHPDLSSKNTGTGRNIINNNNDVQDYHGHGTAVSGIIAAVTNNGEGIAGISWGALIMPVKCGNTPDCYSSYVWNGIYWALGHGAKIINLSLGGGTDPYWASMFQEAIDNAYNNRVVVVAAAGNEDEDLDATYYYPASLNHVITVGATNQDDIRCSGASSCQWLGASAHGDKLDVMAPGSSNIWTTDLEFESFIGYTPGDYVQVGGTSIAAPFVSGLVALMLSKNPNLSPDQVEDIIKRSADDLDAWGRDKFYGYGRINAYTAVRCANRDCPGDANKDFRVDGLDYSVWLIHYDQTIPGGPTVGDFDNNGKVDGIDYVIWLSHYDR
jgi:subtilisin family serine protease